MSKRVLHLNFHGHPLNGIGPCITIFLDGRIIDELEILGEYAWSREFDLEDGDHVLEIIMHNEDNDRFFEWGDNPNGEIRYLTLRNMHFANDGIIPVEFDLAEDDLEDGTMLFVPNPSQGLTQVGQGIEIYRNFPAKIIIPARKIG